MKALLLVDIPNDYFPGGKMELCGPLEAAANARKALEAFRSQKLPVIHIRHISERPGSTFFIPGTPGSEIHQSVAPLDSERILIKHFPNSFRETELDTLLKEKGIQELSICGMMTHMCIDTTVRAAFDLGYKVTLLSDATATRNLKLEDAIVPAEQVQASFLAALSPLFCKLEKAAALDV